MRNLLSTQFGRAMRELGIEQVFAWSPQAKGRVERAAGTFQDRLVTELRLADVRSLEEANRLLEEYLPRYNEQFGVPAVDEGSAYRPLPPKMDLEDVLCFKHRRKVARDNTVKYQWRTLQLLSDPDHRSYAGKAVEVWERLERLRHEDQPHGCRPTGKQSTKRNVEVCRFGRSPQNWESPEAQS